MVFLTFYKDFLYCQLFRLTWQGRYHFTVGQFTNCPYYPRIKTAFLTKFLIKKSHIHLELTKCIFSH